MSMTESKPLDKGKFIRSLLFIGGCTSLGYAFGWMVGVGIFCCAPALFAAIRRK